MTSEINDEFKAPINFSQKDFLAKKTLKLSSIKEKLDKNHSKLESESDSDEELNKYKIALSGKFNLKNILKNRESLLGIEKDWTPNDYKYSTPLTRKPCSNVKINELLSILPKPKNKVFDKSNLVQSIKLTNNVNKILKPRKILRLMLFLILTMLIQIIAQ